MIDSPTHPLASFFPQLRAERRAARSTTRANRTRAIITIVYNEPVFQPIWLRYYSRFFGPGDMYVLDNETTDGSTDGDGFVRIPVERKKVDHTWMVRTIEQLQHELLDRYDVVVVTDVDEIISPVPEWGTLGEYLDGFDERFVNCLGYEVLHMRDEEPPLDLSRAILDQRRWWFYNAGYDKAAIATEPMRWRPGFHGREDFALAVDPDLRLIHLHRMDFDLCRERHVTRSRRRWAWRDARRRWARHNKIVDEAAFADWFYADTGFDGYAVKPEPMSPSWRGVV